MVTVALSSIPPRFGGLHCRLQRIAQQGPDRIFLSIPWVYDRFPDWDGDLPDVPANVTIERCLDRGPATKFLTAFAKFPDDDILIADDDCDYGIGWLDAFKRARKRHPNAVIAASRFCPDRLGQRPGGDIVQGFAGVMLKPVWLQPGIFKIDERAQWVDDIWLSAHISKSRLTVVEAPDARSEVIAINAPDQLQDVVIDGASRADLNRLVAQDLHEKLGVW